MPKVKRCSMCGTKGLPLNPIEEGFDLCKWCREYRKFLNWYQELQSKRGGRKNELANASQ